MRRIILNIMLLCWSIAVVATSETYTVVISLDGCPDFVIVSPKNLRQRV